MCKIVFLHMSGTPTTGSRRSVAAQNPIVKRAGRAADINFQTLQPSKHNTKESRPQRPLGKISSHHACTDCRNDRIYSTSLWRTPTPATSSRRPSRWSRASAKRPKPRTSLGVRSSCRPSCWLSRRIHLMGVRCMLLKRRER